MYGVREVPLNNSEKTAVVDMCDYYNKLQKIKHTWRMLDAGGYQYAYYRANWQGQKRPTVLMHHIIYSPKAGKVTHHKDGDGLNNTSGNLECTTQSRNMLLGTPSTQNRGINWDRARQRWRARLKINGADVFCARFKNRGDAVLALNIVRQKYGLEPIV